MVCTFFGHKDSPNEIGPVLKSTIIDLIENKNASTFYVGNNGNFDSLVKKLLIEIKKLYNIDFTVVLAYMPRQSDDCDTLYPEGLENVPPRFCISARNNWMIENSDYVVTYVTRSFGGSAHFKSIAEKKGKTVISLGQ